MLTIEEIKKALDAGEVVELECVDREGYKRKNPDERSSVLNLDKIIVTSTHLAGVSIKNADVDLMYYELQYFRIKRPTPTFDDLIDVAAKAFKDGVLGKVNMNDIGVRELRYKLKGEDYDHIVFEQHNDYSDDVDFINSLYTETFVIESERDISRVKSGDDIELTNGNKCTFLNNDDMWRIKDNKGFSHNCGLLVLKGATVTQKRGSL